jgi:hypothetical protein
MPCRAFLVHAPKRCEYDPLLGRHGFAELIPMGLFALAAQSARAGHAITLLQLGVERRADPGFALAEAVVAAGVEMVGFSLHWHHQTAEVLAEVRTLAARCPGVRIVLGGITATALAAELLADHPVDAVCLGEGEACWAALLDRPRGEGLGGIPNLAWRDGAEIVVNPERHVPSSAELDDACFFDPGVISRPGGVVGNQACPWVQLRGARRPLQRLVISDGALFPLMTVRGCLHECGFCAGSRSAQRRLCGREELSWRSAEAVLETARAAHGAGFRSLLLEALRHPSIHAEACAAIEGIARQGLGDRLIVECRDEPRPELIEALGSARRAGIQARLHLSPDLGTEAGRRHWKSQPVDDEALRRVAERSSRQGVPLRLFLVAGLPTPGHPLGEPTAGSAARLARLPAVENVFVHSVALEPGAPMGHHPERYGIEPALRSLEDYRELHARPRFPPPLGFAPAGADPAAFSRDVQSSLCVEHCPVVGKTARGPGRAAGELVRRACRLRAARGPRP